MCPSHLSEEAVSRALFEAAIADGSLDVLSWQAVDGKGYFTADVKLRLPTGERLEPDLICADHATVWLIEVKARHSEALADEAKLARIPVELGMGPTLDLLSLHSGVNVNGHTPKLVVAYDLEDTHGSAQCNGSVGHLEWSAIAGIVAAEGLSSVLRSL